MVIFYQQNKQRNKLFVKREYLSFRFIIALFIAIGLMITDYHNRMPQGLRSGFSVFVAPLQFAIDYPARFISWTSSFLGSKKALLAENIQLRYQQTLLEARLQTYLALQTENSELKELLSASSKAYYRAMAAQILAVDTSNARQLLVIDKGSRNGVSVGLPVLDAKGIMGQIIDVGPMTSTVLLVSDAKCAVPVRNDRTGERAILVGTNNIGQLMLLNLPKTSLVAKGDLLVTSGLGRLYPEGYPVARVEEVVNMPGDDFIKVVASPVASINRSRLVLLIWPDSGYNELTHQLNERLRALEGLA